MRRIALLMGGAGLVAWGVAAVIAGCGNDDPVVADTDSGSSSGSSGTSGGTSGTSGGSSGNQPLDSGNNTSSGVISNPGKITCAAVECDAGDPPGGADEYVCCVREAGTLFTCGTDNNCGGGGAFRMACDESADCTEGDNTKCCFQNNGTSCNDDCPGPGDGIRVCKTDAECGDAGACAEKTCGAGNRKVRVCGTPEGCQ